MMPGNPELIWLWSGIALLMLSAGAAVPAGAFQRTRETWVPRLLTLAAVLVATAIAVRWYRLGHGPFFNMFEILMSSIFSLTAIYLIAIWRIPHLRVAAPFALAVLSLMALWLLTLKPADTHFVPSYDTSVLWFHVLFGKLFLGCALIALSVAALMLGGPRLLNGRLPSRLLSEPALDRLAWGVMRVALLFETMMLVAGAIWAQDAWGRYWAWDPLETWALVTWLTLLGAMHARRAYAISPRQGAWMIVAVFVLAFLTFFGVPFVSVAPHKGAV